MSDCFGFTFQELHYFEAFFASLWKFLLYFPKKFTIIIYFIYKLI